MPILPSDVAFEVFIATSCRERMSAVERRLFDFHRANTTPAIEKQIRLYRNNKARGKRQK